MPFQFLCPQGHLLQAELSQVGQQCQCPFCQSVFLIPAPLPAATGESPPGGPGTSSGPPPFQPPSVFGPTTPGQPADQVFPGIQVGLPPESTRGTPSPGQLDLSGPGSLSVVHIACPSGHELETPREMLGQQAMCPFCQAQFLLRFEDSVEYRQRLAQREEYEEAKKAKKWLQLAIVAAVGVVAGLIALMVLSSRR